MQNDMNVKLTLKLGTQTHINSKNKNKKPMRHRAHYHTISKINTRIINNIFWKFISIAGMIYALHIWGKVVVSWWKGCSLVVFQKNSAKINCKLFMWQLYQARLYEAFSYWFLMHFLYTWFCHLTPLMVHSGVSLSGYAGFHMTVEW